jgi:hypothetical protein
MSFAAETYWLFAALDLQLLNIIPLLCKAPTGYLQFSLFLAPVFEKFILHLICFLYSKEVITDCSFILTYIISATQDGNKQTLEWNSLIAGYMRQLYFFRSMPYSWLFPDQLAAIHHVTALQVIYSLIFSYQVF